MPKTFIDEVCGRALCSTCDFINLKATSLVMSVMQFNS